MYALKVHINYLFLKKIYAKLKKVVKKDSNFFQFSIKVS